MTYAAVILLAWPLGIYMAHVYTGRRTLLSPAIRPVERVAYRALGVREGSEQTWVRYLVSLLALSSVSVLVAYVQLRFQGHLPLNPQRVHGMPADLAVGKASFSRLPWE